MLKSKLSLTDIHADARRVVIYSNLSGSDQLHFSHVCRLFYNETKSAYHWKNRLISLGLNEALLKKFILLNLTQDYRQLYRTLFEFADTKVKDIISLWELCCLSGELKAIQYAEQYEKLNKETINKYGENGLHLAAMSGSFDAVKYMIEVLEIPAASVDYDNFNSLHYTALNSSYEAVKYLLNAGIDPYARDNNDRDAFWYAEKSSNSKKTMEILSAHLNEGTHNVKQPSRILKM